MKARPLGLRPGAGLRRFVFPPWAGRSVGEGAPGIGLKKKSGVGVRNRPARVFSPAKADRKGGRAEDGASRSAAYTLENCPSQKGGFYLEGVS